MEGSESDAERDPTDNADEPENLSDGEDHVEYDEVGDEDDRKEFATLANDGSGKEEGSPQSVETYTNGRERRECYMNVVLKKRQLSAHRPVLLASRKDCRKMYVVLSLQLLERGVFFRKCLEPEFWGFQRELVAETFMKWTSSHFSEEAQVRMDVDVKTHRC
ncbi:hypothetical protein M436DRAFT_65472 [Aureobasidium namibiae CBS 147.97]|uniref:Uncharacterized protein n=1 Tax=Aureobasidium namibiae CBS 147.97 TaxID=1043004 RepID=A0A074WNK7_9PEZI